MRNNPKGLLVEQWCCAAGCGQWFRVERDTVSHRVGAAYGFEHAMSDVEEPAR
jgi:sarcosine oxidase subunit delta